MKFFWFGDSWIVGDELAQPNTQCFARLVSDYFNAEYNNCGTKGSSITALWQQLQQSQVKSGATVFFGLTASIRHSLFDEHGVLRNILLSSYPAHGPHPYSDEWFKYFDNPYQRAANYSSTVLLLWLWCQHKNIDCYFFNLFTTEAQNSVPQVPESAWLVPPDQCVAQWILDSVDNQYGSVIVDDNPSITEAQWAVQREQVEQYIRPCHAHPNPRGHEVIAQNLIKNLLQKKFFWVSRVW